MAAFDRLWEEYVGGCQCNSTGARVNKSGVKNSGGIVSSYQQADQYYQAKGKVVKPKNQSQNVKLGQNLDPTLIFF